MNAPARIAPLARLAALEAPLRTLGADGVWLAEVLASVRAGETFEIAAGIRCRGTPLHVRAVNRDRDALIRQLAPFFPAQSLAATARLVEQALARYGAVAWPRERMLAAPRAVSIGTPNEILWRIWHSGRGDIAYRQIFRILSAVSDT